MTENLQTPARPPAKVLVGAGRPSHADRLSRVGLFLGRHLRSPITMVCLVAALLIAVRWYVCLVENRLDRIDAEQHVSRETGNLTQALEAHARRLLRDADHDVEQVARETDDVCGPVQLKALQAGRLTRYPLAIYRDTGARCAGATSIDSMPDQVAVRANGAMAGTRLHFSTIRLFGKAHVLMTRDLRAADGRLAGHVVIEINAEDLIRPIGSLDLGPDGVAMVSLLDGEILARQVGLAVTHGRRATEPLRGRNDRSGSHHGTDGVDEMKRYFRYHRLADFPLVVAVGLSDDEALGGAEARASSRLTQSITATVFVSLVAIGMVALLVELKRARRRGTEAERLKQQFLNVISHELRTPLNGILGFSELLQKQVSSAPANQYLQVIRESALQLNGQIEDMLTFVDVESGNAAVRCHDEQISTLIERLVAVHAARAHEKGLTFEAAIAPGTPATAHIDASRTLKILDHLVQNAIKFSARGGVRVAVEGTAGETVISVSDTGSGITEVAQQHLAESFRQADGSNTRAHGGVGLGLALCAGLARLMGLQLEFSSTPGEGSTFSIRIPARTPGAA